MGDAVRYGDLEADLRITALPPSFEDGDDTFLRSTTRGLLLLAPEDVQMRVGQRLAAIRDELDMLTVEIEWSAYTVRGSIDVPPGVLTEADMTGWLEVLGSERGERSFAMRLPATPWEDHVFDRRIHTRMIQDVDTDGVAGLPPALDPWVGSIGTGPYAIVRQTPLERPGWVQLHLDLRHASLLGVRSLELAGKEEAHMDLADVAFEGVTQTLCVPLGGGVVFVERREPDTSRVFIVRAWNRPDVAKPEQTTFLNVIALTAPLQGFAGLPIDRLWMGDDEEVRRRFEVADVLQLFPSLYEDLDQGDDAHWISMAPLAEKERSHLRSVVADLERSALRTAQVEIEIVESQTVAEPEAANDLRPVSSATLFGQACQTARAAIGRCVSFLGDWDVEVSMGVTPTDPVLEQEFLGTWAHVTPQVVRPDRATFHLELFVHAQAGETRTVHPTKDIEPIELPVTAKTRIERDLDLRVGERVWLGRVPGGSAGRVRHAFARLVRVVEFGD
ncbi:MAG: hypothetical protein H6834_09315 [Planctomycetes bacterium]|nr:hypothetical protein [Planctomycetota bacterium]